MEDSINMDDLGVPPCFANPPLVAYTIVFDLL